MPKPTVQKYPNDETDLHSAIRVLVDYFDMSAETFRRTAEREQSDRERAAHSRSPQRSLSSRRLG
jgi:hypothetical protein